MAIKVGVFLGIDQNAGGMFQYASSILNALVEHPQISKIEVLCGDEAWDRDYFRSEKITLVSISRPQLSLIISKLLGLPFIPLRFSCFLSKHFNPIAKHIHSSEVDCWVFPSQDLISFQVQVRSIVSVHDLMHRYESSFPEVSKGFRYWIREHRFKSIGKKSSMILVDSRVGSQQFIDCYKISSTKIRVLPYIAPSYIYQNTSHEFFLDGYNLPKEYIFYPAQFWEHKNHKRLLLAVKKLSHELPNIHLVLSGSKNHKFQEVYKLTMDLGLQDRIHFLGYVPNSSLRRLYKGARALIMPTFFGPTNIPPLEAIECGCPVAVSRIYGMMEQLGNAALYFDPNSVDEIAEAIRLIWSQEKIRLKLLEEGHRHKEVWNVNAFNDRLGAIISDLVNGKRN